MKTNEIKDIVELIAKSGVYKFELEIKDFKIITKNNHKANRTPIESNGAIELKADFTQTSPPSETSLQTEQPVESNYSIVRSTMVGTFHRSSGPDRPPLVSVGDEVKKGQKLCSIVAMNLFYDIESTLSGKIVNMLVEDASPVEYDTHLFTIDPA